MKNKEIDFMDFMYKGLCGPYKERVKFLKLIWTALHEKNDCKVVIVGHCFRCKEIELKNYTVTGIYLNESNFLELKKTLKDLKNENKPKGEK